MNLTQLLTASKVECAGTGSGVQVSDFEITNMLNEVYTEICVESKCILNSITANWVSGGYLDIRTISGIVNPIKPLTILDNNTNWYLSDEGSRPIFNRMRLDWETWTGNPLFWDLIDPYRVCFAPFYNVPYGNYTMGYYSYPTYLSAGTDVPLLSSDVHIELIKGVVWRYLESIEEFSKAEMWENDWNVAKAKYVSRVQGFIIVGSNVVL